MKKNQFNSLAIFSGAISPLLCLGANPTQSQKPNIVIIFPDQFRQNSLGFWSQNDNEKYIQGKADPTHTPALDKLANQSVVFSQTMSNFPLSSPFRGMMLTGMYPDKNGLTGNCHKTKSVHLNSDAVCISDVLANEGYETAYFGKCHWVRTTPVFDSKGTYVGTTSSPGGEYINPYDTYVPPGKDRHSFNYFFQTLNDSHYNPMCYTSDSMAINGLKDGEMYRPHRFSAEFESEAVINYLDNTHQQRDNSKPFLMVWSLNPPHSPWTLESTNMKFFPQYTVNGKVELNKLLLRQNADSTVASYAPYYFANVSAVDYYIGIVLDKLKEQGLDKNTIIVFCSDHGEMLGSHGLQGKNVPEVEAFNIPFMIKWDGKLKHQVNDLILSIPDIMPTLLGLAGLESKIPAEVQGRDFSTLLLNPKSSKVAKPTCALYIGVHARGLFTEKYTFVVEEEKGKFADAFAYDNKKDPYQLTKIPASKMDSNTLNSLKSELSKQLKLTEDKWAAKKICNSYLSY
ncbi:MAG: sulfatase [Bacteroidales bacterium]|nr:sulfatase [Bacteroidales bacterium]